MITNRVSPEQYNINLEKLSTIDPALLNDLTVAALRSKVRECNIRYITPINRGSDEPIPTGKARKDELLQAINVITSKQRIVNQVIPELNTAQVDDIESTRLKLEDITSKELSEVAESVYKSLREYTIQQYDATTETWKTPDGTLASLAARVTNFLVLYKNRVGEPIAHTTRMRYRTFILNFIKEHINNESSQWFHPNLVSFFDEFKRGISLQLVDSMLKKKEDDKLQFDKRQQNAREIKVDTFLQRAYETLASLTPDTPKTAWIDVSIALGIATGRRQAEIHCSANFSVVGEYEVAFTGQLKTKGESTQRYMENPSYNIPTLLPAELVVNGLRWLAFKGKRVDDVMTVNKRYNKELGIGVKQWAKQYIEVVTDVEGNPFEPDKFKYHALRELYVLIAIRQFCPSNTYPQRYSASILGHSENDISTCQRYDVDYKLAE